MPGNGTPPQLPQETWDGILTRQATAMHERLTRLGKGNPTQIVGLTGTALREFSVHRIAAALREHGVTIDRIVGTLVQVMDDPQAKPREKLTAIDRLRQMQSLCAQYFPEVTTAAEAVAVFQPRPKAKPGRPLPSRPEVDDEIEQEELPDPFLLPTQNKETA
jgi:hypothetical protein